MIKEPKDLYEYLINNYSLSVKEICEMHTSCDASKSCETKQNVKNLLNFDDVMKNSYIGKGATPPSVDGITYKEMKLIFVEIKGWKMFLEHQKKVSEEKIKKQIQSYNFQGKFISSIELCVDMIKNEDFWKNTEVYYLIVSDSETNKDSGVLSIMSNLSILAESSNSWDSMYNKLISEKIGKDKEEIEKQLKYVTKIHTYIKSCTEYDKFYNSI